MKQHKPFLEHIRDEINYLLKRSNELTYEDFVNNPDLIRSFARSLEIIGEAIKNLSKDFKNKYPHVPWKEIVGLRDILIHHYFGVNYKLVWDIVKNKIPKLKGQIEDVLRE